MFIVVAIVIFGIFVSLSYTLFGKTLQPSLLGLFEQGTEQASSDFKGSIDVLKLHLYNSSMIIHSKTKNSIDFNTNGAYMWTDGVYIGSERLKPLETYKLSYDLTSLEGNIVKVGGHISVSDPDEVKVYINGKNITGSENYLTGISYKVNTNETIHVEVEFKADKIKLDEEGNNTLITDTDGRNNMNIYIQPNRGVLDGGGPIRVKLDNIEFLTR